MKRKPKPDHPWRKDIYPRKKTFAFLGRRDEERRIVAQVTRGK